MTTDENAKIDPELDILSEEELAAAIGGAIGTTTHLLSYQMFVRSTLDHFLPLPPNPC